MPNNLDGPNMKQPTAIIKYEQKETDFDEYLFVRGPTANDINVYIPANKPKKYPTYSLSNPMA
jgi:hypothetical protein